MWLQFAEWVGGRVRVTLYNTFLIKSFPFHSMASFCFQEQVQAPEQRLRWLCGLPSPPGLMAPSHHPREGFLHHSSLLPLSCQILLLLLKWLSNLPFHPIPAATALDQPFCPLYNLQSSISPNRVNISILLFLIMKAIHANKKKEKECSKNKSLPMIS